MNDIVKDFDTIGMLQSYAHLVRDEHKVYIDHAKRFTFKLEGLKVLRDSELVPLKLRIELTNFMYMVDTL